MEGEGSVEGEGKLGLGKEAWKRRGAKEKAGGGLKYRVMIACESETM